MSSRSVVPRAIGWLLAICVPADEREALRGDLIEEYDTRVRRFRGSWRAGWWYARQVWTACGYGLVARARIWSDHLRRDLKHGARSLWRNPGFTCIAVVSLAVGIAANTAIFSVIDVLSLRTLPVPNPHELVMLRQGRIGERESPYRYQFWQAQYEEFRGTSVFSDTSAVCLLDRFGLAAGGPGAADSGGASRVALVTGNYFTTLGVQAAIGRTLLPEDDRAAVDPSVAVVSNAYWRHRLRAVPDVLSQTLTLNGTTYLIVGVAPPEFTGDWVGRPVDVWVPAAMHGRVFVEMPDRLNCLRVIARLAPGVTATQAEAAAQAVFLRDRLDDFGAGITPEQRREAESLRLTLHDMSAGYSSQRMALAPALRILMAIVALVLLGACANVANLALARAAGRRRQMAVHLALGAGRGQLVHMLIVESVLVGTLAGVLGFVLSLWSTAALATMSLNPVQMDARIADSWVNFDLRPDGRVLAFTALISLVTAVCLGIAAAPRGSATVVAPVLGGRSGTAAPGGRFSRVSVIVQVAVSLLLLVGAGLFARSLSNLRATDVGVDRRHVLLVWTSPGQMGRSGPALGELGRAAIERLSGLPGVIAVSASNGGLLRGDGRGGIPSDQMVIPGQPPRAGQFHATTSVAPRYFATLGLPILAGREFIDADLSSGARVAVVNETFARFFFDDVNAVGRRFAMAGDAGAPFEIVGVVPDMQSTGPRTEKQLWSFTPYNPRAGLRNMLLVVRTTVEPAALSATIRKSLFDLDPALPVLKIDTVDEQLDDILGADRLIAILSSVFGLFAMGLASLGLYGVVSLTVARRTSEIGVRMALGATRAEVLRGVLQDSLVVVLIGAAIGVGAALAGGRLVSAMLFGVSAVDPLTIAGAAGLLIAVATVASLVPARRAATIDPVRALRYE